MKLRFVINFSPSMNRLYDNIILQKRFPGRVSSSNAIPKTAKGYGIATRPAFVNKEQIMLVYAIFYVLLIINLTKAAPHSGKTLGHSQNSFVNRRSLSWRLYIFYSSSFSISFMLSAFGS
jgi:hypothetical protein